MPRYRFVLPVRAIGAYRLPDVGLTADSIAVLPAAAPAYTARVENIVAENATIAFERAQQFAEQFFGYLALLGEDAAFILDGREGVRARNRDLEDHPIPIELPPPPFESIGGVITADGQGPIGEMLDPDGSKRRSGGVVVHNSQAVVVPGQDRLAHICDLFGHRDSAAPRLRVALGIVHDAACAREFANGFAQCFTALEVLTENLKPPTVLDEFFQQANGTEVPEHKTKRDLLSALRAFLAEASLSESQIERIVNYAAMAQSASQVDVFLDYLTSLGVAVTRNELSVWRGIRGALVHAAAATAEQVVSMRRFREVVRAAVVEELRRAASA